MANLAKRGGGVKPLGCQSSAGHFPVIRSFRAVSGQQSGRGETLRRPSSGCTDHQADNVMLPGCRYYSERMNDR